MKIQLSDFELHKESNEDIFPQYSCRKKFKSANLVINVGNLRKEIQRRNIKFSKKN